MASLFFSDNSGIAEIKPDQLNQLKRAAEEANLRRARFCLHRDFQDPVQEMVIAFCRDSYIRPHKHVNKSESFHVIEGNLAVVFFDDNGEVIRKIEMGPVGSGRVFMYRLNVSLWHTVIPLSDNVILHETTTGPFIKSDENNAKWSPDNDDKEGIRLFLEKLKMALHIYR